MSIFDDSDKKADDRMEQIIETFKNKDQDALKAMFSKQALDEANDFDGSLNALFNYIEGDIQSWKSTGGYTGSDEKNADGSGNRKKKSNQPMFLQPVNKNTKLQYMSTQSILLIQIMWGYIHFAL